VSGKGDPDGSKIRTAAARGAFGVSYGVLPSRGSRKCSRGSQPPCNVLFVYPKFSAEFVLELFRYCRAARRPLPHPPTGIDHAGGNAAAGMVGASRHQDADLDWADMVMTGGMLFQQADTLCLIGLTQDRHKPVVVGGPDVTSSPHIYSAADFRVLGRRKRSSPRLSLAGRHPLGGLRGSEVPGRRYEVADPALRSAQFQGLSFRRCPILARLPVHL
jgi:hypothetical protein